jgi:hypothetical protein
MTHVRSLLWMTYVWMTSPSRDIPNPAWLYDYYLGSFQNFEVDRKAVE